MPVKPLFEWEQTSEDVLLEILFKGCKREAVDVLIADVFVKANAPPQYLLAVDLLHEIDPEKSTHYFTEKPGGLALHLKLHKAEPERVWDALSLRQASLGKAALLQRRQASMQRAEQRYRAQLDARVTQRETEKRRMLEAQWEVEREQRAGIEQKVKAEKDAAEQDLFEWETATQKAGVANAAPQSPADIFAAAPISEAAQNEGGAGGDGAISTAHMRNAAPSAASVVPAVRQADTLNVTIDFTPKTFAMPTRSRGDEDYYRQSRYKPVSIEDTPMFWKERADKHYRAHEWKAAADAYTESVKRDGAFLTCVMNRAACFIHLAEYKRAVDDCSLALTMLANTPASEVTQDRYRGLMTKLYARRGAAHCWADDLKNGVADLRMAAAYRDPANDDDVAADLALVEALMAARGIVDDAAQLDPLAAQMQEAATQYYQGSYEAAEAAYRGVLADNPYHAKAQSNLVAVLLRQGKFKAAFEACEGIIAFCGEVAAALEQPGGLTADQLDSDDEEEDVANDAEAAGDGSTTTASSSVAASAAAAAITSTNQEGQSNSKSNNNRDLLVRQRRLAAKKLGEQSGHVYMLLKAYVRSAAALCGLKEYHKAHVYLERALRITPYDNDLRDDCNRLAEKIRMETLVAVSAGSAATSSKAVPAS